MPKVIFKDHEGNDIQEVQVESGSSVMQATIDNGIEGIDAECGGACSCATCHCYIDDTWLERVSPAQGMELDLLQVVDEPRDGSRLACQVKVTDELDGVIVSIPESQY